MRYGYARCSTDPTRQKLDRQMSMLTAKKVPRENIYSEYASGTHLDRSELQALLKHLQPNDSLYVTELDRLTRSIPDLLSLLRIFEDKRVRVYFGDVLGDFTSGTLDVGTRALLFILGAQAEVESHMTSQRIKSGMANAKAKGKHVGRPKLAKDDIPTKFWEFYLDVKRGHISKTDFAEILGVDRKTVYRWIAFVEKENLTTTA